MRAGRIGAWISCIAVIFFMTACEPSGFAWAKKGSQPKEKEALTELVGLVFRVSDGDTLRLRDARGEEWRVRLHGIDSPEREQEMGREAGIELAKLVKNKNVRVMVVDTDKFGRVVGRIYVGKTDVNCEIVRLGYAWHYVAFAPNDKELSEAEAEARREKRGIWSKPNPIPPWTFRKMKAK